MKAYHLLFLPILLLGACGDSNDQDPLDVQFGETTFVMLINPVINDANQAEMPQPGQRRSDIQVELDDGPGGRSDSQGLLVLSPVPAGARTLTFDSGPAGIRSTIAVGELQELSVALDGEQATLMHQARYAYSDKVIEVTSDMPLSEVNQALAGSQTIVFFKEGTYEGDLVFSGSDVTLFGKSLTGGEVLLVGDVIIEGSGNRIRGATITGKLTIKGSDVHIAFSRLEGPVEVHGSSLSLMHNILCQPPDLQGSGVMMLDNAGLPPLSTPEDCGSR